VSDGEKKKKKKRERERSPHTGFGRGAADDVLLQGKMQAGTVKLITFFVKKGRFFSRR